MHNELKCSITFCRKVNYILYAFIQDDPISHETVRDDELPFSPKPQHCKMMSFDELNSRASKLKEQDGDNKGSRFFRLNPMRRSAVN